MEDLRKLIKEIANPKSDFHKNNPLGFKIQYLEEYFEKLIKNPPKESRGFLTDTRQVDT